MLNTEDAIFQEGWSAVRAAYERALASGKRNMNAMSLATVDAAGAPSIRTVLLKTMDANGLLFFTDKRSRKGQNIEHDPRASICFYWEAIEEQVRVDGHVQALDEATIAQDFQARPRTDQILISTSVQSHPIDSMADLASAAADYDQTHPDELPVPPQWTGYRLVPHYIETWQGRRDRLHQRIAYTAADEGWAKRRLQP
jgi:pyridoxamine 5'-phosphate oxidase